MDERELAAYRTAGLLEDLLDAMAKTGEKSHVMTKEVNGKTLTLWVSVTEE